MAGTKSIHTESNETVGYKNSATYDYKKVRNEKRKGPSATVNDQNYTMREILNRFTSGSPINDMGVYNDFDFSEKEVLDDKGLEEAVKDFLPHPKTMDLVDRQNLQDQITDEMFDQERKNEKTKKEKWQKKQDEERRKFEEDVIKKHSQTQTPTK